MSTEISEKAKVSALGSVKDYFLAEAMRYFADGTVSTQVAKQLTLSAVIAADTAIENGNGATWQNADLKKFASDVFRLIGYGIDFGNKEAYVITYRNPKTGKYDLTTPVSADGLVKLAKLYATKPIDDVKKFFVREGDEIAVSHTTSGDVWTFNPVLFSTKPIIGYMTVVIYKDGMNDVEITTIEEVEKRRKASKASNSPAWTTWYAEMSMAKSIRKHMKRISINLPSDITEEPDYEPVTKDCGDIGTSKIQIDYPTLAEKQEEEKVENTTETDTDSFDFTGTPFASLV